jgi:hypothetical protein
MNGCLVGDYFMHINANQMKRIPISLLLAALATWLAACGSARGGAMAQPPSSPALSMRLADSELASSKALAGYGNCAEALKVARHYSFGLNDIAESISWLQIAAKCPAPEPKAELAYLLLSGKIGLDTVEEVESLIAQVRATNPGLAEKMYEELRVKLGKLSG